MTGRSAWIAALALAITFARGAAAEPRFIEIRQLDTQRQELLWRGRFEQAIPVNERLVELSELELGRDHVLTLARVGYLAYLHRAIGDWARAEELYERVIAAYRRTLPPGRVETRAALSGLAELYEEMGLHERAEPIRRAQLADAEEHPPGVPEALDALARLYLDMGAFEKAEALLLRALAIVEEQQTPLRVEVTSEGLGTKGEIVREESGGGVLRSQPALLTDLGNVYLAMDQPARAEPILKRASSLNERAFGPESAQVSVSLGALAMVYQRMGDDARAEEHARRTLAMREKLFGVDHPRVATALHNLAGYLLERGEHARAEAAATRALGIVEKAHGPHHRRTADVLLDLAGARIGRGDVAGAVEAATRAAAIQDRDARIILAAGSEAHKRAFMAAHRKSTDAVISIHARRAPADEAATRLALTTVLRRKGRVMDAMIDGLSALRRGLDDEGRALLDRLARTSSRMAAALRREGATEGAREELASLEAERRALEGAIAQKSADFRADRALVTIEDVERAVPEGSALVEIVAYRPHRDAGRERWGALRYAAYVLRPGRAVGFADLGDARAIDEAASALRRALADPDLSHDPRPPARALDARIGGAIRALIGDARHAFVSPDGALALVPFGALVGEDGRFLAERVEISYLTSGRDLLRFSAPARHREPPLVLADPAFGATTGAREAARRSSDGAALGRIAFAPLPGSAKEARAIEARVAGARVLLGERATEVAIKAARGPALLHVATHGFFLAGGDEAKPSAGLDLSGRERAASLSATSPLLRSGIALAGANLPARGAEDGILTALEASSLDLLGTRLAVLSACETGVGEVSTWEGVIGMRRALAIAGAETQVMSLWPVDSGATRELMTRYYEAMREGAGRSEAMRAAQLAMIADPRTAHPNLWAAFIVSGSPRALDGSAPGGFAKVAPGARGCGCSIEDRGSGAPWAAAIAVAIAARRSRRARRRRLAVTAGEGICRPRGDSGDRRTEKAAFTAREWFL